MLGDSYTVYGLSCCRNLPELEKQIDEFRPSAVAVDSIEVQSSDHFRRLKGRYPGVEFIEGEDCVALLAGRSVDVVVSAIVGAAGLRPSFAALNASPRIALANKETLVMAGPLFMSAVKDRGVELIPVDSEHSAIFSLLHDKRRGDIDRIILTASGGSLRNTPMESLADVSPEQALDHPTWNMGSKITIDSATLMNKGLEVIEAHHLFNVDYEHIDVIIHKESIVHSMVETVDGSVFAHLGIADMALPILNALTYPEKIRNNFGRLDLTKYGSLNFHVCDDARYPALKLCYEAGKRGGTAPAALNAANEIAVDAFLKRETGFTDIAKIVEKTLEQHGVVDNPSLGDILDADRTAREISAGFLKNKRK
jgi:1-deoxy-D-xylulose-5-phosphate reductoisomerase